MTEVDRALARMRKRPGSLPREPSAWSVLDPSLRGIHIRERDRMLVRNGWCVVEEWCRDCGRVFQPAHRRRCRCDGCAKMKRAVRG